MRKSALVPKAGSGELRAGDEEREATVRRLRDHCAAGRLTLEELDERAASAYAATTVDALERLVADLPDAPVRRRPHRSPHRNFWPGVAAFHEERRLSGTCAQNYAAALRQIVPRMGLQGFQLVDEIHPRRMRFRDDRGLEVTVMFHPAGDATDVSAFGEAPRAVRKAFAELRD